MRLSHAPLPILVGGGASICDRQRRVWYGIYAVIVVFRLAETERLIILWFWVIAGSMH